MTEWQPIETAPKDGTSILVYGAVPLIGAANPYTGAPSDFGVVRWRSSEYEDFEPADGGMYRKVMRAIERWEGGTGSLSGPMRPTHWMPLPSPPQERSKPVRAGTAKTGPVGDKSSVA